MTNEEIQLMHKMRGFLTSNKTHEVLVTKATPGSDLPELLRAAEADHRALVDKLTIDSTKSDGAKLLFAAKSAEKQIMALLKIVDSQRGNATALKSGLEAKVSEILSPEEANPVDTLTRVMMFQTIRDMPYNEALALVRQGDTETAKCLQLPLAKAAFKLDKKQLDTLQEASEKCLLGTEYEALERARLAESAYLAMGTGLSGLADKSLATQRVISETVVEEAA